ncbi:hypothetical protein RUND412_005667 [Rhizina undulata]
MFTVGCQSANKALNLMSLAYQRLNDPSFIHKWKTKSVFENFGMFLRYENLDVPNINMEDMEMESDIDSETGSEVGSDDEGNLVDLGFHVCLMSDDSNDSNNGDSSDVEID